MFGRVLDFIAHTSRSDLFEYPETSTTTTCPTKTIAGTNTRKVTSARTGITGITGIRTRGRMWIGGSAWLMMRVKIVFLRLP
jgi:hypothetical protein